MRSPFAPRPVHTRDAAVIAAAVANPRSCANGAKPGDRCVGRTSTATVHALVARLFRDGSGEAYVAWVPECASHATAFGYRCADETAVTCLRCAH